MKEVEDFYEEAQKYIRLFNSFAKKHSLSGDALADHICYKCGSEESFEYLRALFEDNSEYIYQSIIAGRRIAYIKFKKGIKTELGTINFLELSDQKPDGSQKDGFDHIEVYATAYSCDDMVKKLGGSEKIIKVERPHHTTHDIDIGEGFLFRATEGALIEKIKSSEME